LGHIAADYHKFDQQPSSSDVEISEIKTKGGEYHPIKGSGNATVKTESGTIKLKSVSYVPSMTKNLISVGATTDSGYKVIFSDLQCWILDEQGCIIGSRHRDSSNGLYYFKNLTNTLLTTHLDVATLWHRHLRHLSYA